MPDLIHYPELIDLAMRSVVREVLRKAAKSGLPGEHHFYITFRTDHPSAKVSDALRARYPHEMTVVLQHQYWDFRVEDHQFQVSLSFGGVPERLVVPFTAITSFADPSVKFGLQFQAEDHAPRQIASNEEEPALDFSAEEVNDDEAAASGGAAEIISLDAFRKK